MLAEDSVVDLDGGVGIVGGDVGHDCAATTTTGTAGAGTAAGERGEAEEREGEARGKVQGRRDGCAGGGDALSDRRESRSKRWGAGDREL